MDQQPKFVQIAIGSRTIIALDSDGVIWDVGPRIRSVRALTDQGIDPHGQQRERFAQCVELARREDCGGAK